MTSPLVLAIVASLISFAIANRGMSSRTFLATLAQSTAEDSCEHPDCYIYAAEMAAGVDYSVNPCDDFYQYACGQWIKNVDNPELRSSLDYLAIQGIQIQQRLRGILILPSKENEFALMKAKNMFQWCQYKGGIPKELENLKNTVQYYGDWTVGLRKNSVSNEQSVENVFNVLLKLLTTRKITIPLSLEPRALAQNNTVKVLLMSSPEAEVFADFQVTAEDIVKLARFMNSNANDNLAYRDAQDILALVQYLNQISTNFSSEGAPGITINDFTQKTGINWLVVYNTIFQGIKQLNGDDLVFLNPPTYFAQLIAIARKPREGRALINLMLLNLMREFLLVLKNNLPDDWETISFLQKDGATRWKECIQHVASCYDGALALKYAELYHDVKKESELASELTQNIADVLGERLKQSNWLDEPSKKAALDKLAHIRPFYEYPNWVAKLDEVNEFYKNMPENAIFTAHKQLCDKQKAQESLMNLVKDVNMKHWSSTPLTVNAFYTPTENDIRILEGIMQEPSFNPNRLRLMNYADLGYVIGHEITHGFDNQGVKFDAVGNEIPWLSETSQKEFDRRTQCLIQQYSQFKLTPEELPGSKDGFQVNGTLTLGENIADDGGLKWSHAAYKRWAKENGEEILPSFLARNFTTDQAFFLAFARSWCVKYTYSNDWSYLVDVHSPDKFRINGPLSNFEEFGKTFNCEAGTKMNRGDKRCNVW